MSKYFKSKIVWYFLSEDHVFYQRNATVGRRDHHFAEYPLDTISNSMMPIILPVKT